MSANFFFDLVDPAVLTEYVRVYDDEVLRNEMVLERFLPNFLNDELEWSANQGVRKDVDVAEYRAWDTQPRMTGRQGLSRIRGELAPVSRQIPLTEEEHMRLRAIRGGDSQQQGMIDQIFADAELMVRAVQMRIELARAQVLTTGAFTLAENGLFMSADFGLSALSGHMPVAAASWALVGTDIISDLLAWTQKWVDDNGSEPGVMLGSRKILGHMYKNTSFLNAMGFGGTTPTRLNNEQVDAVLATNDLPPFMLYDVVARINGVSTRLIPDDKLLFLPAPGGGGEPLGRTHYGITAEAIHLAGEGFIEASAMPGVVAVNLRNDSPVQTFTLGTAVAVPTLPGINAVIVADVIP